MNKMSDGKNKVASKTIEEIEGRMGVTGSPRPARIEYLQEKARIKHEIGDLEAIRLKLGLSQRRLCRLLLVDPSAWTRWLKMPEGAPPHVYKALSWLLQLQKTDPSAAVPSNFGNRLDFIQASTQTRIKELEAQVATLERTIGMAASAQPIYSPPATDHSMEIAELRGKLAFLNEKLEARKPAKRLRPKLKVKSKPKAKRAAAKKKLKRKSKEKIKSKKSAKKRALKKSKRRR